MASISASTSPKLNFPNPKFSSNFPIKRPSYPSLSLPFPSNSNSISAGCTLCRCLNPSSDSPSPSPSDNSVNWRWDSMLQDVIRNAIKQFDSFFNSRWNESQDARKGAGVAERDGKTEENNKGDDEEWDWDRWRKHFQEVDEQERLVSVLKSQLGRAVYLEDYEDAARLKVAIAAAATSDTVGRVMSHLNRAVKEERYGDAAFIRDNAGAGLVGWWAGISKDVNDPHGLIIRITPEHGRYVARSYSPRQLATSASGVPLFEIFLTMDKKGEYKLQAVYLKRRGALQDLQTTSSNKLDAADRLSPVDSPEDRSELFVVGTEDPESSDRDDSSDPSEGLPGFQNILKDMIPGVKVKVLKVTTPEKVDKDLISKVIEQIIEEEDEDEDEDDEEEEEEDEHEEKDGETENLGANENKVESNQEKDKKIELGADPVEGEVRSEVAVKVVISGLVQKFTSNASTKDLLRVPAKLEKKGHVSFSFTIEKDINQKNSHGKERSSLDKSAKLRGQRSVNHVMLDLAKFVGSEKVPLKVLKEVGELINLTLSQAQNHQPLSGSTIFNRIELPASPDPLNGLYIGAHGLYSSEVIHLRRRFGQWQQEDVGIKESENLEFYEYVEALKLTGDPYVPAGQVAFRAKVGKRYQLPHKGIIPEEFGVVARYKGQGRLAEPGFRSPRWVDGELVILDGKYIKGGPVVGFVYWAPEYHFLVFFNRLRLQE
ncbi:protein EXECUTER 1, chloroplastic-like [Quillaja saponaria]|uniref:Protein EXECUTER 1, chloroplastic-like n=1 Tax=Quillaja saponaria TaxID=32244 RepID=A0AAD7PV04_QUISA|nr:protein EXECUTER 1, chloroplastic-like [Quillaja saponaria]